jgi:thioredoxin reductase (NADPH)
VPSLEALLGRGVFYGASPAEARLFEGKSVYLVGAGNSAGQAAIHLAKWAHEVTIVVRGDSLEKSMSKYLVDEIAAASSVAVLLSTRVVDGTGEATLQTITLSDDADGSTRTVPADALFLMIGAQPRTDGLPACIARDGHGFVITGTQLSHDGLLGDWPLARVPFSLETSTPGVFAVGDVRAGSMKRVASAAGEGSAVIKEIHTYFEFFDKWEKTRRATT